MKYHAAFHSRDTGIGVASPGINSESLGTPTDGIGIDLAVDTVNVSEIVDPHAGSEPFHDLYTSGSRDRCA